MLGKSTSFRQVTPFYPKSGILASKYEAFASEGGSYVVSTPTPPSFDCEVQCKTRSSQSCCSALYDIRAAVYGNEVASVCDYTTSPSDQYHWDGTLTPIGPGDTPGTTKYSCVSSAVYITAGNAPLTNYFTIAFLPGSVTNGGTIDIPWGIQAVVFTVVQGVGNPFGCSGSMCVSEFETPWTDLDWGTCSGVVASIGGCDEFGLRSVNDAQTRVHATGLVPGQQYNVTTNYYRRAFGSSDPWVFLTSRTDQVTPTGSETDAYTVAADVPNAALFETIAQGCSVVASP